MPMLRRRALSFVCSAALASTSFATIAVTSTAAGATVTAATVAQEPTSSPEADKLSGEAVEAFGAKRYDEAIDLFNKAYQIDSNPNYLFNIGRVYEEKGDLKKAVEFYQRFVSQAAVDLEAREAATARLKVLREALGQLEDEKKDEGNTTPPPNPNPNPEEDKPDRVRIQRIAGYSLIGVGAAALIVGGVLGGLASADASSADDAEFVDDKLRLRDDARGKAQGADALFITGGVLAAVGVVLVVTTLGKGKKGKDKAASQRSNRRSVAFSPSASPRAVGATFSGRF